MRTVVETPIFIKYAANVWTTSERNAFVGWIAANPSAGNVIPGSGGCRKVRWSAGSHGKRGGARIIDFLEQEHTIWLLIVYAKSTFDDMPPEYLARLRRGIEDALGS